MLARRSIPEENHRLMDIDLEMGLLNPPPERTYTRILNAMQTLKNLEKSQSKQNIFKDVCPIIVACVLLGAVYLGYRYIGSSLTEVCLSEDLLNQFRNDTGTWPNNIPLPNITESLPLGKTCGNYFNTTDICDHSPFGANLTWTVCQQHSIFCLITKL